VAARGDGLKNVGLVIVLVAACALPFAVSGFRVFQCTQVGIYAIALLGLNILTGYNGQFSLGHGAFYAIGAYTTAIMIDRWSIGYGWTIPVAGVLCLVVGFLFGWPALRLEGLYLALATFSLALALPQILKYFEHWTGGSQGIVLSKPKAPWGLPLSEDQWLYFLTLGILIALFVFASNLLRGCTGRAIVAIGTTTSPRSPWTTGASTSRCLGERRLHGRRGRPQRHRHRLRRPGFLRRVPVRDPPHGHRHRGARHHIGGNLRRHFHSVRAKLGPGHLQGGPLGHLRRLPHRLHVRDAARDCRLPAPPLDPMDTAGGCE
jgi:hypothetical protein